jgi:spermidine synthase
MSLYINTFLLAFCSIVYELLLGQALSAFLGNTVLRYSITIGLYMLSLGIGSLIAEGRFVARPVISLLLVETLLTLIGGSSVILLFLVSAQDVSPFLVSAIAHGLIIVIGILSGFEIPLLIQLKGLKEKGKDNTIIGINYLGAFLGTVIFALILHPHVGIVATAFWVALSNALVGIALVTQIEHVGQSEKKLFRTLLVLEAAMFLVLIYCLSVSNYISETLLNLYLGT